MFTVHCPRHGREILLDSGRVRGLDNTTDGIVVTWECWCGHVGTTVTGRTAPARPAVAGTRPASGDRPVAA